MNRRCFRPLIVLMLALSMLFFQIIPARSQTSIETIRITKIDPQAFPQVDVQFLALSPHGAPINNLAPADIKLLENEQEISGFTLKSNEVGVQVAWVIDEGAGINTRNSDTSPTRFEQARDIIMEYVGSGRWMRSSLDASLILARTAHQTETVASMSTDTNGIVNQLRQHTPPGETGCSSLRGVSDALEQLHNATTAPEQQKFVVALIQCSGLDTSVTDSIVKKSLEYHIPLNFILLRGSADEYQFTVLQNIAKQTGGTYVRYQKLSDVTDNLFPLFTEFRTQTILSYRSRVSKAGTYTVVVETNTSGAVGPSDSTTYTIDISDPVVTITYPQAGSQVAECVFSNADTCTADPETRTVVAEVTWPDGHPRNIASAQLQVDNGNIGQPVTPNDPSQIELPWDLSGYNNTTTDTYYNLDVVVEDELGRAGTSDAVQAMVALGTKQQQQNKICDSLQGSFGEFCDAVWPYMSLVNILLSVLAIALVIFLWFNRGKVVVAAKQAGETVIDFVERVTKRRSSMEARAWLVVAEGLEDAERKSFEIYGTTPVGRSHKHADLVFQANDDNSPLSRLHATILDEGDRFMVRDEDSANGTYLNGKKLLPLEPVAIRDGDKLELGQVQRGGILFIFQTTPPVDESRHSPSGPGKPYVEEDLKETRPRKFPGGSIQDNDTTEDSKATRPRKFPGNQ